MFDPDRELDNLIQTSTQSEVPKELEERLRLRLAEFQARIELRPVSRLRSLLDALLQPPRLRVPAMALSLAAVLVLALLILPLLTREGRAYAQAVAHLRSAQSLQYTVVLAPFTEIEFSYRAPGQRRVNCSWGIEIRTDNSGRQIVLLHLTRQYALEAGSKDGAMAEAAAFLEQLRALPEKADEKLGQRRAGGKSLYGYRVRRMPSGSVSQDFRSLDLWVDATTGSPDDMDISFQKPGQPLYQIHLQDIRLDAAVDPAQFDTTPPAGYSEVPRAVPGKTGGLPQQHAVELKPQIEEAAEFSAVVLPMKGSYLQAGTAVAAVEAELKRLGVQPAGPAFGLFGSEQDWEAGLPVPAGTKVGAPFRVVTIPKATIATATVSGPWGQDSAGRWAALFEWVTQHGYWLAGPPMEYWSGGEGQPEQSTVMRIAVKKAH